VMLWSTRARSSTARRLRAAAVLPARGRPGEFGALVTPVGCDWDADSDQDWSAAHGGEIGFIENLGGFPPKWAAPVLVEADGRRSVSWPARTARSRGRARRSGVIPR